ncbi:MAG: chemotaxis-specific protein-glutamate methyltransferase CheB [Granulosicoccus sp.]
MASKRILVVDDSCLFQRLLSDAVNARPGLEVIGVASNGRVALDMVQDLKPDLVTLDILMPELDGIQTLTEIKRHWPDVVTMMVSSLTVDGSDAALDALALGAGDCAVKPQSSGGIEDIRQKLEQDFIPKLEALCGLDVVECDLSDDHVEPEQPHFSDLPESELVECAQIKLVAIGVSTGGPDALGQLLPQLPVDLEVPIVIVQHMPAEFTAKLAARLDQASALKVVEAKQGESIQSGMVYIAPGDNHMVLSAKHKRVFVSLNKNPPENSCRPAVDVLFRSISTLYEDQCLGIVMTGMGQDGLKGAQALHAAGSRLLVQDQESSVVWGMPKLIAKAGLAEAQVPLKSMAAEIVSRVRRSIRNAEANSRSQPIENKLLETLRTPTPSSSRA